MTTPLFEKIELRTWQDSDFDAAVTLNRESEEHIGIGPETGNWATDMAGMSETFEGSGGELLVGELDEKIVVMGGFKRLSPATGEVKRMRVSPELQGKGIGPWLLGILEAKMQERGVETSIVSTLSVQKAALKLYARAGYIETGRKMLTEGPEEGFTVVSFTKRLV